MVAAEPTTTTTTTEVVSDAGVPLHVEGAALTSEDEDMKNVHRPIISRLVRTVNRKQHQWALDVFYEIMAHNRVHPVAARIDIPHGVVKGLFHLMEVARPFDMFQIVRYYETLETTPEYQAMGGDINGYARMYNRVCDSLRHIDPVRHSVANAQGLVRRILAVVQRFDRVGQEMCYPTIVSSMVEQKYNSLGMQFARPVYNIIVEQNMTVSKGFWHHLLSFSRYNRHCDLPYDDVLTRMVEAGQYPRPVTVLNALDNFFPFTDFDAVAKTLKVVLRMQQEVAQAAKKQNGKIDMAIADLDYLSKHQFYVDMFTLEMIGSAAASRGRSDINLLVWDMVDVLGYTPTEGIFENTVTAFAMNTFTYREAFTVLAEMTNRDFQPSRALIRSFSVQVRYDFLK